MEQWGADPRLSEWMAAYQRGDASAVRQLVDAMTPKLARLFGAYGARPEDIEEAVQETWLRVHKSRHTWRSGAPVEPWLYAIARRTRADRYRRSRRIQDVEVSVESMPDVPAPEPREGADLGHLIAELPESQREVLVMTKVLGMSLEEVARATSTTVGAVKQKAFRAYERLRERMGR